MHFPQEKTHSFYQIFRESVAQKMFVYTVVFFFLKAYSNVASELDDTPVKH